jgi:SecD/SecF fusion protein
LKTSRRFAVLRWLLSLVAACFSALGAMADESFVLEIERARAGSDGFTGQPVVELYLSKEAQAAFGAFTGDNIGARADLLVDGEVVTSPVIHTAIYGPSLQISGIGTMAEAEALAGRLGRGEAQVEMRLSES